MDFVHDALGRTDEVRYPEAPGRERFVLQQVYDVATGELLRRNDVTNPQAPAMLWQVDERTLDGTLRRASYGAGAVSVALQRDLVRELQRSHPGRICLAAWAGR